MLRGTLDDFTLADLFKLLSFSKKTGRVELKRKAGMGRVFFRDGDVYFAESSLSREPLGQKLIRSRALTESHLRQALDEHADTGERVGQILLREGWIDEAHLEEAVKQQIEDAVFDLLRWDLGDFEWEPHETFEPEIALSVSVENLIMESSRRLDELEIINRKVASSHCVIAVAPAPPEGAVEINITPDEWRVLVLVDGHRTVETIANTIGLDEFHTMKIVHGMVAAGLVAVVGTDEEQALPPSPPQRSDHVGAEVAAPPPPPPLTDAVGSAIPTDGAPGETDAAATEVDGEADAGSFALDEVEVPVEPSFEVIATEAAAEQAGDSYVDDALSALSDEPVDNHVETSVEEPVEGSGRADPAESFFPQGEDVLEETLFEADTSDPDQVAGTAASPPEEWFTDPDLSMELFDSPSPGDLVTELPDHEGVAPSEDLPALEAVDATEESHKQIEDEVPSTNGLVEAPAVPDAEAPAPPEPQMPKAPPPPPVAPVEGEERTRVVRELSGLFDDGFIDRPKRPVIRRIEPTDPAERRRVEDDEQVTKSLISRLIEGVKGL